MTPLAATPEPPYFAVIFTSVRRGRDPEYDRAAARMVELARHEPGFLGVDSARDSELGITVSYWRSLEDIERWRTNAEHLEVQRKGKADWYEAFTLRVARVERAKAHSSIQVAIE